MTGTQVFDDSLKYKRDFVTMQPATDCVYKFGAVTVVVIDDEGRIE